MHFGIGVPHRDAVLALRDRLSADGIELVEEWDEPEYVSVKCRDPDADASLVRRNRVLNRLREYGLDKLEWFARPHEPGGGQGVRRAPGTVLVVNPRQGGGVKQA
jgi:hypothetical protein